MHASWFSEKHTLVAWFSGPLAIISAMRRNISGKSFQPIDSEIGGNDHDVLDPIRRRKHFNNLRNDDPDILWIATERTPFSTAIQHHELFDVVRWQNLRFVG